VRSALAAAAVPAAWFAQLVAVPAVLVAQGWQAWQVGLLLLPSAVVAVLMPRYAGALLRRRGSAHTLAVAGVGSAAALLLAAAGAALASPVLLLLAVVSVTLTFGLGQPALMAAAGESVEAEVRGVAVGIATLVFLVGGSIGSAVVGGVGDAVGIPLSLVVLAVLALAGLVALRPLLGSGAPAPVVGTEPQPSSPS